MRYMVVFEKSDNGYAAYLPDLPGCVAAGDTVGEVKSLIREAVVGHLELTHEVGDPVPSPKTSYSMIEV